MTDKTASPSQFTIDFADPPSFKAEDFVPTPSNEVAVQFLDKWPDWAQVGAILIGPEGAGKSHLAAILQDKLSDAVTINLSDVSAKTISDYGNVQLLILDHQSGGEFDEEALFHVINHFRQKEPARARLLILSRQAPIQWGLHLPDLLSRLSAFDMIRIDPPDDFSLEVLLNKLFADSKINVDQSVIAYLLKRMPRSYQAAHEIVKAIDQVSLARKSKPSRTIAAKVLDDLDA